MPSSFLERAKNLLQNCILVESIASNFISKLEFTPVKKRLFGKVICAYIFHHSNEICSNKTIQIPTTDMNASQLLWPNFHNGVAAGLKIARGNCKVI